jgi:hypothetical protein
MDVYVATRLVAGLDDVIAEGSVRAKRCAPAHASNPAPAPR